MESPTIDSAGPAERSARVVLQAPVKGTLRWLFLDKPEEIYSALDLDGVRPVLRAAEAAAERGRWVAGFVGYAAAPAFDAAMTVRGTASAPLAWFAVFDGAETLPQLPETAALRPTSLDWQPSVTAAEHAAGIEAIHRHIARGDTYQVNYTLPLTAPFDGSAWELFLALCRGQRSRCCAYVDTGERILCSASPELFFRLENDRIRCRPMKGTAARGRTLEEDRQQAEWLRGSAKNRAENVMIVDMVRNDLGRIARPETVRVAQLCQLETYPSVFQLTSTVEARTVAPLEEIFTALFPCASVTGAPKIRSMEIIRQLEPHPRGIYTGAVGIIGPGRRARFNVAIRTVEVDAAEKRAAYGIGSGIVWDSVAEEEWRECRTKARILDLPSPDFELLETLLWTPEEGYALLERHLHRLATSASYFGFPVAEQTWRRRLTEKVPRTAETALRVRLLLARDGALTIQTSPLETSLGPWRLAVAAEPVSSSDPFLHHKTTHRRVYDRHKDTFPDHDDVLLWNERGEITESTLANVLIRRRGRWVTPPIDCGLLGGTLRAELLERGEILEEVLDLEELGTETEMQLINSVRGRIEVVLDTRTLPRSPETRPSRFA